jgi:hypothetical protein
MKGGVNTMMMERGGEYKRDAVDGEGRNDFLSETEILETCEIP